MNTYKGLVAVIPTRDRSELAVNAIRSLVGQVHSSDLRIVVSDNSTDDEHFDRLRSFCNQLGDSRICYLRPPYSMSMTKHWDWVLHKAMDAFSINHFLFLGDRVVFKPGAIAEITEIVQRNPARVISYFWDEIVDFREPVSVTRTDWSGKLFAVDSSHQLLLASQCFFTKGLPKMLNSVAPRSVLEKMRSCFGNVFDSISPDYCFAYRCLATQSSFLFYDKTLLVGYALGKSNGLGFSIGKPTKESMDFEAFLEEGRKINDLAPIPEINLTCNAIVHEYYFVKNEIQSANMPDIDFRKYLYFLAEGVKKLEVRGLRRQMLGILRDKGWKPGFLQGKNGEYRNLAGYFNPKTVSKILSNRLRRPRYFPTFAQALQYTFTYPNQNTKSDYLEILTRRLGPILEWPES